jgi:hypothetical protein
MFMLCGAGLVLLTGRLRRLGWICAAACLTIALLFLSEYIVGWKLGIDELPFRDAAGHAAHSAYPGRPAPTTLFCFVVTSIALGLRRSRWHVEEALMVPVLAVASMCLIGYAYAIPAFYGPAAAARMPLNAGIAFLVLGAGVMFATPHGRSQRILANTNPGTVMARRLLPLAVLVPLTLGWLRLVGQEDGIFGLRVGTWLLTMTTISSLVAVIVWSPLPWARPIPIAGALRENSSASPAKTSSRLCPIAARSRNACDTSSRSRRDTMRPGRC